MTKKISLNISERVKVIDILNAFKGNLDKVAVVLKDIVPIAVTEEDWTKAKRVITPAPTAEDPSRTTWSWKDEEGGTKEIELDLVTIDIIRSHIKEKNDKGEFSLSDRPFITLQEKIA